MTDKELSDFGERLYESVLFTPLPAATLFHLSLAVRQAIPWAQLPQHLKFAVFKIAASCVTEPDSEVPADEAASNTGPASTTSPAAPAPEASAPGIDEGQAAVAAVEQGAA